MAFDPLGAVGALFGVGGDGGGGAGGFPEYLAWIKEQQAEWEEMSERERERSEVVANLRRGELLDRTGYSGTVNVGPAVRRTDETLAAEMDRLAADDPVRQAYNDALAAESVQATESRRIVSGEQYRAEDAFEELQKRYREEKNLAAYGLGDFEDILADLGDFSSEYDWMDTTGLTERIDERISQRERVRGRQERKRGQSSFFNESGGEGTI